MTTQLYQALIVDDEPISCKMMTFALTQMGFSCDAAKDGDEALRFCKHREYDLVVTDLIMPNRNGHSLAVDLLANQSHPVVIVHTSVNEPRLTKDLLTRGVDEVVYKPTNYKALASRAIALVEHRKALDAQTMRRENSPQEIPPVESGEIERKLAESAKTLPVSQAALDLYNLTTNGEVPGSNIAAALAQDPVLNAKVLRLADAFCRRGNTAAKKIADIDEAVVCLGQKRIAELAMAASVFTALTATPSPGFDVAVAWRRGIASAVAIDLILTRGVYPGISIGSGLFLGAFFHHFGRFALNCLYPRQYKMLVERCKKQKEMLDEQEERVFHVNHGQVIAGLLKAWNVPQTVVQPLQHAPKTFAALSPLGDSMRNRVELLKMAIFIAQLGTGLWECWDTVDFPTDSVLRRTHIEPLPKFIEDTRADTLAILELLRESEPEMEKAAEQSASDDHGIKKVIGYANLSSEPFDFLRFMVASMGISLVECVPNMLEPNQNFMINCLWNPPQRFNSLFATGEPYGAKLIITDPNHDAYYKNSGQVITLPTNFGLLQSACKEIVRHVEQSKPPAT